MALARALDQLLGTSPPSPAQADDELRLRAAAMQGLLAEILAKGALSGYDDPELKARVQRAVDEHEQALRSAGAMSR